MTGVNKSKKDDDTTASYSTWLNEIDPMITKNKIDRFDCHFIQHFP